MLSDMEALVIDLSQQKKMVREIATELKLTQGQVSGIIYRHKHGIVRAKKKVTVAKLRPRKIILKDALRVRRMFRSHSSFDDIVAVFGGKYDHADIQRMLTELRQREREKYHAQFDGHHYSGIIPIERPQFVPPEVLAQQQERIMLRPRTITALICGDPLPGESALDRRCA